MNNTIIDNNKILLGELLKGIQTGDIFEFYEKNESKIIDIYRNYTKNKVANTAYSDEFKQLELTGCGRFILSSLNNALAVEEANALAEKERARAEENYNNWQDALNRVSKKARASKVERFFACAVAKFITDLNLESKYGFLTHQSFRTNNSLQKTVYGTKLPKNTPLRREVDFQVINKDANEKMFFMVDGKTNHNKRRDDISSEVLKDFGSVIRFREKGAGGINKELCTAFNFRSFNIDKAETYEQFKKELNKTFKKLSPYIPEATRYRFEDDDLNEIFDYLTIKYDDLTNLDPMKEFSKTEIDKIISVRDELISGKYTDPRKMLEKFLSLNLTGNVKKKLGEDPEWAKAFKLENNLRTKVRNLNKKCS